MENKIETSTSERLELKKTTVLKLSKFGKGEYGNVPVVTSPPVTGESYGCRTRQEEPDIACALLNTF